MVTIQLIFLTSIMDLFLALLPDKTNAQAKTSQIRAFFSTDIYADQLRILRNGNWYHSDASSINAGSSPWIAKFNASVALTPFLMQVEI